jgi:hypothetical protein
MAVWPPGVALLREGDPNSGEVPQAAGPFAVEEVRIDEQPVPPETGHTD